MSALRFARLLTFALAAPFLISLPLRPAPPHARIPERITARLNAKAATPATAPDEAARYFFEQRLSPGADPAAGLPLDRLLTARDEIRAREAQHAALRASAPGDIDGWQSIGPGNIGGRTREILINPVDPDIMYAAGVAGGIFKSTDAGASWSPTDDFLINLAVACMVMDPTDPDVIYAGTGEGFGTYSALVRGLGIFKSTDAGGTWTLLPTTSDAQAGGAFHWVNELAVSPNDPSVLYAATRWGVYKSTDAGDTWQVSLRNPAYVAGSPASNGCTLGCLDVAVRPDANPDVVWAAFGGNSKDGLFRSDDAGATWTEYVTPSYQGRMEIAIAPSDGDRVYVGMSDNGGLAQYGRLADLWRADDGLTFQSVLDGNHEFSPWLFSYVSIATGCLTGYPIYSQGWYDQVLEVDPTDPDVLFLGGINVFRSDDAGATFGLAAYWFTPYGAPTHVHADQHEIVFHPDYDGDTNQTVYVGNDGGLYRTDNARAATSQEECGFLPNPGPPPAVVWEEINHGYAVTQYYHGDAGVASEMYVGGAQDNGTSRALSTATPNGWARIYGGDGGYVAIDPTDSQTLYVEIQGFPTIQKSTDGGDTFNPAVNGITDQGGVFIAAFAMDPTDPQILWTGTVRPWRTTDGAANWTVAGADLAGPSAISAIAVAPSKRDVVYLGYENGYVAKSTNGLGASPSFSVFSSGLPLGGYVSSLAVDPQDHRTVYATYANYGVEHIWRSTNGGNAWTSIDGIAATGVPDIPVHWIAVRPTNSQQLYAGTELGVFASDNGGGTWQPSNAGLANTVVETLDFVGNDKLVAFTHGRGAFVTTLGGATGVGDLAVPASATLSLAAAPVPARSGTTLRAALPRAGHARIAVHDVTGRLVAVLHDGPAPAGELAVSWDGTDRNRSRVAAGTYFARVTVAGEAATERIVLIR